MKKLFLSILIAGTVFITVGCSSVQDLGANQIQPTILPTTASTVPSTGTQNPSDSAKPSSDSTFEEDSNQIEWSLFEADLQTKIASQTENGNCQYLDELFNEQKKQITPGVIEPLRSSVENLLELISQNQSKAGCK